MSVVFGTVALNVPKLNIFLFPKLLKITRINPKIEIAK
jgi:hypothetical protein